MHWSTEDTLKLLGLILFLGSFAIVIQQLLGAQARLDANSKAKEGENKSS